MPRNISIYGIDRGDGAGMKEPDVGSRALLTEKPQSNSADPESGIASEQEPVDSRGLPVIEAKEPSYTFVIGVTIALQAIGAAIATAIYTFGSTEAHTSKIQMLAAANLHWVYASAGLLSFTVRWINFYPGVHKSMVMTRKGSEGNLPIPSPRRSHSPAPCTECIDSISLSFCVRSAIGPNLRSNPFIYKAVGTGAMPNAVVFDNDGHVGAFNRANRSLHHMVENIPSFLVALILAGYVFPRETFVCTWLFCVGRIMHQTGYTNGYGGHGIGFALLTLAAVAMEGLMLVVAFVGARL